MPTHIQPALAFLSTNTLRNIVLLKMLTLFPAAIECHYCEDAAGAGAFYNLPVGATNWLS